ncbi:MAG TPA: TIGR03013 family XrtA/PEP-CTERM system glycosyltransferase [Vicinamibacterales bacterium]|jgi:sugar transferase (PEP-CTERM system associated)
MATVFMQRVTWRSWILIAAETGLIVAAVSLAAYVRLQDAALTSAHLSRALVIAFICQVCLYYAELYDFRVLSDRRELVVRLLQSLGATSLLLAAVYFWFPSLIIGRGVFILATAMVLSAAVGWRAMFEWVSGRIGHRERLLLVGTSAATVSLASELRARKDLGIEIVGFVDHTKRRISTADFEVLGTLDDIPEIVRAQAVDRVVVSLSDARGRLPMDQLLQMKLDGVRFDHLASVYEECTGKIAVENLRPSWFIFSSGFRKSRSLEAAKRAMDIVMSLIGIVLTAPIMLMVAALVRITSPGPVIYQQQRVGKNGRVFTLYKFRSMRNDAEKHTGAVWATAGDTRVTPIGRFLRKARLDELPQFWNVLRGDMSFVGPRPERPEFVNELTRQIPFYGERHTVRPGLTGWAQVTFRYGATVEDSMEKLQCDLFYIKNLSIALDLFVILKTIQTVVLRRGT